MLREEPDVRGGGFVASVPDNETVPLEILLDAGHGGRAAAKTVEQDHAVHGVHEPPSEQRREAEQQGGNPGVAALVDSVAGYNHGTVKNTSLSIARHLEQGWERPRALNWLLLPLSWLYGLLATLHRLTWRTPLRRPHRVGAPVVVVGNITAGGTGKTPLVLALAEYFTASGRRPGIVSRGYGGASRSAPRLVETGDSPAEVGDEPLLLRRRSGAPVAVCPDRHAAARLLVDEQGCDVIISDDGLQHYRMHRDLDIVVIDGIRGLGNGWCLPSGPLREPACGSSRVDLCVLNGGSPELPRSLRAPAHRMNMAASRLYSLDDPERRMDPGSLAESVHAVAGLGNPESFFRALESTGLDIIRHPFADHHSFALEDFDFTDAESIIVMTEKDAVKCAGLGIPGAVWVLPVTASLDAEFFNAVSRGLGLAADPVGDPDA